HPVFDRLLHARRACALVNARAVVIDAVADHRPAVILAGLWNVDLVAAHRTVLMSPELPGLRVQGCALHVAVAVAPDFRPGARLLHERIVRRHAAIRRDADHLATVVGEILPLVAKPEMLAGGEKNIAVTRLHDAAAEVIAARRWALLLK